MPPRGRCSTFAKSIRTVSHLPSLFMYSSGSTQLRFLDRTLGVTDSPGIHKGTGTNLRTSVQQPLEQRCSARLHWERHWERLSLQPPTALCHCLATLAFLDLFICLSFPFLFFSLVFSYLEQSTDSGVLSFPPLCRAVCQEYQGRWIPVKHIYYEIRILTQNRKILSLFGVAQGSTDLILTPSH